MGGSVGNRPRHQDWLGWDISGKGNKFKEEADSAFRRVKEATVMAESHLLTKDPRRYLWEQSLKIFCHRYYMAS